LVAAARAVPAEEQPTLARTALLVALAQYTFHGLKVGEKYEVLS
jgi:hypothetical protein